MTNAGPTLTSHFALNPIPNRTLSLDLTLTLLLALGVAISATTALAAPPERLLANHLPNAYRIHDKVISGGQPDGDAAFRELAALGVKTIISVDGATPQVELAKKYGIRYVHLPHGYDGIPASRANELAKAVHVLPGPIYIHCHQGKHRSPTAAAVACVAAGLIDPGSTESILTTTGTSPAYRGLYQSARNVRPLSAAELNSTKPDFRETAVIPRLAQAMSAIEHKQDVLKLMAASDWKALPDYPDLDPAHEALLFREDFEELLRTPDVQARQPEFRRLLAESHVAAQELESALKSNTSSANASAAWQRIITNCTTCHQQFRDIPLTEK
jgi:protein tyrosine phosphatase (PTP) superfamily phosphohydrolase (DUF442 family)